MSGCYMKRNTGLKLVKYFGICFKLFHLKEIYHVFVSRILKAGKKAPILVVQHYPEYSTSDRYKDATLVAVMGACEALYVVKHFLWYIYYVCSFSFSLLIIISLREPFLSVSWTMMFWDLSAYLDSPSLKCFQRFYFILGNHPPQKNFSNSWRLGSEELKSILTINRSPNSAIAQK